MRESRSPSATAVGAKLSRLGLVVHPTRSIEDPVRALREWASVHSIGMVHVDAPARQQQVAEAGDARDCELIVSIGGDGTMLAALRAAAVAERPVLGVACGSLGALTTVRADALIDALERFVSGDWMARTLPALDVTRDGGEDLFALNDIAVVRAGPGQAAITAAVDGALYAEFAGDGCIVSTPIGSSAYGLAAGGPLLAGDCEVFVFTPLTAHGGFCPSLVLAPSSTLRLATASGHGGIRLEVDGQLADRRVGSLTIGFRAEAATVVAFADEEPLLTSLRRRQIIIDSPRILARGAG